MGAIGLSLIFGTTGRHQLRPRRVPHRRRDRRRTSSTSRSGMNLIPATLCALLVGAVFGYLIDKGLWGPLRRRGTGLIAALVVSIGLSLVLRYVYLYVIGGSSRSYAQYATQQPLSLGPISIPPRDLVIMGLSVAGADGRRPRAASSTRLGKATRAVADNPSLAALLRHRRRAGHQRGLGRRHGARRARRRVPRPVAAGRATCSASRSCCCCSPASRSAASARRSAPSSAAWSSASSPSCRRW